MQQPVDLTVVGQPLQRCHHGSQVESVLLQGLVTAILPFDRPLQRGTGGGEERVNGFRTSEFTSNNRKLTEARALTDAAPRMTTSGLSSES